MSLSPKPGDRGRAAFQLARALEIFFFLSIYVQKRGQGFLRQGAQRFFFGLLWQSSPAPP